MVMPILLKRFRSIVHMLYDIGFHAYVGVSVSFFIIKKLFSSVFLFIYYYYYFFIIIFPFFSFGKGVNGVLWSHLVRAMQGARFFYDIVR